MAWLGALALTGCFAVPDLDLPLPEAGVEGDGGGPDSGFGGPLDSALDGPLDGVRDAGGVERDDAGAPGDATPDSAVDAVDLGVGACRVDDDCALPGATAACTAGRCVVVGCAGERHDLDGAPGNGCEYRCARRGDVDGCDTIDDDCDGRVDEDAEQCDCADRCVGARAESMCRGEVCVIEACAGATYSGDGRAERGCACDVDDLDPRETPIERLPAAPAGARVHYPGDGRPGAAAWLDPDDGRLWAQRVDVEGHPLGEAQALGDFDRPVELIAASAFGERPEALVRATDAPRTVWRVDASERTELFADCGAERCAVALTEEGPVRAHISAQGDREQLRVEGEVIADWGLGAGPGRLAGLACLPGADCLVAVERGQTWLYTADRSAAFGQRPAVALTTVGGRWAAALGQPGEVRLVRWSPAGGEQAVTIDLDAGAIERVAIVEGPDGEAMVFIDDGERRYARVSPDWQTVDELDDTDGFFGAGRVQADGPGGELYHDDALRGWRPGALVFDGAPSGEPSTSAPVAALTIGALPVLVYHGAGGLFGLSLADSSPPGLLLTSLIDRDTPPAAARIGDALLVADVADDRVRLATARPAITRAALALDEPVDAERTTAALHATPERALVALTGRAAGGEPVVAVSRTDADAPLSLTRTGIEEHAPVIAGPGGARGALLATWAAFEDGGGVLLRRVDDDGEVSPPTLGARTFGEAFALAWSPATGRYTLAWLDRFGGGCPREAGDSAWVQVLDEDGEPLTAPSPLLLPFACPRSIRLAAGEAGVVHTLVTTAERGALIHVGPDGGAVTPPTPSVEGDGLDEDAALFIAPAGPTAVWVTGDAAGQIDFACEGP